MRSLSLFLLLWPLLLHPALAQPSADSPAISPTLDIAPEDVIRTTVRHDGERTLTFREVTPIELPPQPETAAAAPPASQQAQAGQTHPPASPPQSRHLFLGATVYTFAAEPAKARSFVRYSPAPDQAPICFWSSANFLHLGSFGSFTVNGPSGPVEYSLIMACSETRLASFAGLEASHDLQEPGDGDIPALPDGDAAFVITSGQPDAQQLALIRAIHDFDQSHRPQLEAAWQAREQERLAREAELKANPPEKQNLVFNYWRIDPQAAAPEASAGSSPSDEPAVEGVAR